MENNNGSALILSCGFCHIDGLYCVLNIDWICVMIVDQEQMSLNMLIVLRC